MKKKFVFSFLLIFFSSIMMSQPISLTQIFNHYSVCIPNGENTNDNVSFIKDDTIIEISQTDIFIKGGYDYSEKITSATKISETKTEIIGKSMDRFIVITTKNEMFQLKWVSPEGVIITFFNSYK